MSYNIGMKNQFSTRLTELLLEIGLSKRAFAQRIGVSAMSISDWTTGKVQPTAENIYLIAECLDVSADYLLGLEDESGTKVRAQVNNLSHFHNSGTIKF